MNEKEEKGARDNVHTRDTNAEKKGLNWVVALVATISLARISHGVYLSITGPTLLFLAENTNSEVSQVSAMFSGRSAGQLLGSACFSAVVHRYTSHKPLLSLGIGLGLNGIALLVTPFLTSLAGLVTVTTIGGWMLGYLDAGMQAVYLKMWGEEGSRPYIQSFHFGFSVGALLSPIIAAPFLAMADQAGDGGTTCLDENVISTTAMSYLNETTTVTPSGKINPISWCFIITGSYTVIISILMTGLALCKVEDKVATRKVESTESRPEEPFKDLWILFLPICLYYFCCVSSEMVYQGYIYAVALCSNLRFEAEQASWLTAVFWTGYGIARGTAIFTSKYVKPSTIIIADLIGTTSIMTIMSIWGEQSATLTWIGTFIQGLSIGTFYPSGVSWSSQVTNMAGTYIFVFAVGSTLGAFFMMPAAGAIYDKNPFSVMYLITGTCVGTVVFFVIMNVAAKYRRDSSALNESDRKNTISSGNSNDGYETEKIEYIKF